MSDPSGTPILNLYALGRLSIQLGDQPLHGLRSRKARLLLVYLARKRWPQSRLDLADQFWPDSTPRRAQANLSSTLSLLRKHIQPHLTIQPGAVGLHPDRFWLDANELEDKIAALTSESGWLSRQAVDQVIEALRLYSGEFLEELPGMISPSLNQWVQEQRAAIRPRVLHGFDIVIDYQLHHGEYQAGATHALRLLKLDPAREAAHRQLMRLLALGNQRHAALRHYKVCRQMLQEAGGEAPDGETTALIEQIRSGRLAPGGEGQGAPVMYL